MGNHSNNRISQLEESIKDNLEKNAKKILNISIIEINKTKEEYNNEIIIPILHLQTAIELLVKYYICNIYGFESILTCKYKKVKRDNVQQYINELEKNNIKTLGFNELKSFLEEKQDSFGYVIKEGKSPFFWIEYDYLEGIFDKFQQIRNGFVHLGINIDEGDKKWLESEFFTIIILFISIILREVDTFKEISKYNTNNPYKINLHNTNLFNTPIDILKKHLSSKAFNELLNNKCFESSIIDIAEDIGGNQGTYSCSECGKSTLVLNVDESEGISKCFYCGDLFEAGYADCAICGDDNTVIYDYLNIKINGNVMQAYCYECKTNLKVYKCPTCECIYSYNGQHLIESFHFECCKENFKDREC